MNFLFLTLASFALASVKPSSALKWSDCGPENATVRFEKMELDPYPLSFGQKVTLATVIRVMDTIPGGFSQLEISRVFSAFGFEVPISLPCIDGYGACTSDLDYTLRDSEMICGLLVSANHTCGLPLHKGQVETEKYQLDVPPLNGIFSLFAAVSFLIAC